MKQIIIGKTGQNAPQIALGCMRISNLSPSAAAKLVETALSNGINFFDHADIYGGGRSEEVFRDAIKSIGVRREDLILQSKCGIRKGMFDFSYTHIKESVYGILKRLDTSYLDYLLLHRPDTLMEPDEVARAFDELRREGVVRKFGVSNCNGGQIALLNASLTDELCINQLQFGLKATGMIDAGLNVNMADAPSINHDNGVLEYCRLNRITIQAWSPFQFGFFGGVFVGNEQFPELNAKLDEFSKKYGVSPSAMAIAWIMRHPAGIQAIVGTTNASRLANICHAADVNLTREDWYALYLAAGNRLP